MDARVGDDLHLVLLVRAVATVQPGGGAQRVPAKPGDTLAPGSRLRTGADDRLVGARSDVAQKLELHTHTMDDAGVMQMMEIEGGVPLPAGATHAFERGADHVMLMGLTRALNDGDSFALTLVFESGAEMTFDVTVDNQRKPGAMGEGMMNMHGKGHSNMGSGG